MKSPFVNYFLGSDVLQVKLMDSNFNVYFEGRANINNPKEMAKLVQDLRMKGVKLPINWFE